MLLNILKKIKLVWYKVKYINCGFTKGNLYISILSRDRKNFRLSDANIQYTPLLFNFTKEGVTLV